MVRDRVVATKAPAKRWAIACAAITALLDLAYLALVPTATWNFVTVVGFVAFAGLAAALVREASVRRVLLAAALSASGVLGALTASVGLILVGAAGCALMALRAEVNGVAARRAFGVGFGLACGVVVLVAVWIAPKIMVR